MTEVLLFAGPTADAACRARCAAQDIRLHPPVRRGDVQRLVDGGGAPCVAVICDGVFQSAPAVSHAEICNAIDGGWQVWGVSSIGAIRAFEMRDHGMHGFGHVYRQFFVHEDFTDDELCLLHLPEPPYLPLSEPLVNLRHALARQRVQLGISAAAEARLLGALAALWFGHRSADRMRQLMLDVAGLSAAGADAVLAQMQQQPVKTLDLMDLLSLQPWHRHAGDGVAA